MAISGRFLDLLDSMKVLHETKNAGYAGQDSEDPWANFRLAELLDLTPFQGCLVRMGDKYVRICNLTKDPTNEQVGEDIRQTLLDLAVYSLIAICLYEETHEEKPKIVEADEEQYENQKKEEHTKISDEIQKLVTSTATLCKAKTPDNLQKLSQSIYETNHKKMLDNEKMPNNITRQAALEEANKFMDELDTKYDLKPSIVGRYVKVVKDDKYLGVGLVKKMVPEGVSVYFDNGRTVTATLSEINPL